MLTLIPETVQTPTRQAAVRHGQARRRGRERLIVNNPPGSRTCAPCGPNVIVWLARGRDAHACWTPAPRQPRWSPSPSNCKSCRLVSPVTVMGDVAPTVQKRTACRRL
jgi:hypothetical protein